MYSATPYGGSKIFGTQASRLGYVNRMAGLGDLGFDTNFVNVEMMINSVHGDSAVGYSAPAGIVLIGEQGLEREIGMNRDVNNIVSWAQAQQGRVTWLPVTNVKSFLKPPTVPMYLMTVANQNAGHLSMTPNFYTPFTGVPQNPSDGKPAIDEINKNFGPDLSSELISQAYLYKLVNPPTNVPPPAGTQPTPGTPPPSSGTIVPLPANIVDTIFGKRIVPDFQNYGNSLDNMMAWADMMGGSYVDRNALDLMASTVGGTVKSDVAAFISLHPEWYGGPATKQPPPQVHPKNPNVPVDPVQNPNQPPPSVDLPPQSSAPPVTAPPAVVAAGNNQYVLYGALALGVYILYSSFAKKGNR
jgi:hypothetical protein